MKIINENVPNLSKVKADAVMPYQLAAAKQECEEKEKEIEDRLKEADKLPKEESPNEREPKKQNNPQLKKLNLDESLFEESEDIYDDPEYDELVHALFNVIKKSNIKDESLIMHAAAEAFEHTHDDIDESIKEDVDDDVMNREQAAKYWEENHLDDPCLADYNTFEDWFNDSVKNGYAVDECMNKADLTEAKREEITLFDRVMIELDKQMAEYSRGKAKRLLDRPNSERYNSEDGELFSAIDDDGITVAADDLTFAQEVADAYDLDTKDTTLGGKPALTILLPEENDDWGLSR